MLLNIDKARNGHGYTYIAEVDRNGKTNYYYTMFL